MASATGLANMLNIDDDDDDDDDVVVAAAIDEDEIVVDAFDVNVAAPPKNGSNATRRAEIGKLLPPLFDLELAPAPTIVVVVFVFVVVVVVDAAAVASAVGLRPRIVIGKTLPIASLLR